MERYEDLYSNNWSELDTVLIYKRPDFQFKNSVIITGLDDCLVSSISQAKLYGTMNIVSLEVYSEELINQLNKDSSDQSIVILSNEVSANRRNIDIIKKKVEFIAKHLKVPFIGIFALRPNRYMKPHTGLWKLLNMYYKTYGMCNIFKAIVLSNEGGLILEKKTKSGVVRYVGFSDVDRAFAHNAGVNYVSIGDYLKYESLEFKWDTKIIAPDIRLEYRDYIKHMNEKHPISTVFKALTQIRAGTYLIMVMGAPRSGKTTYANMVVDKWKNSEFGDKNAIEILSIGKNAKEYTKYKRYKEFVKLIDDSISVVIDGECHTSAMRRPFLEHIKDKDVGVICVDVYCGIKMAQVFNHAHVEQSNNDRVNLYPRKLYDIYKSTAQLPTKHENIQYITYMPEIIESDAVMKYRY